MLAVQHQFIFSSPTAWPWRHLSVSPHFWNKGICYWFLWHLPWTATGAPLGRRPCCGGEGGHLRHRRPFSFPHTCAVSVTVLYAAQPQQHPRIFRFSPIYSTQRGHFSFGHVEFCCVRHLVNLCTSLLVNFWKLGTPRFAFSVSPWDHCCLPVPLMGLEWWPSSALCRSPLKAQRRGFVVLQTCSCIRYCVSFLKPCITAFPFQTLRMEIIGLYCWSLCLHDINVAGKLLDPFPCFSF